MNKKKKEEIGDSFVLYSPNSAYSLVKVNELRLSS